MSYTLWLLNLRQASAWLIPYIAQVISGSRLLWAEMKLVLLSQADNVDCKAKRRSHDTVKHFCPFVLERKPAGEHITHGHLDYPLDPSNFWNCMLIFYKNAVLEFKVTDHFKILQVNLSLEVVK